MRVDMGTTETVFRRAGRSNCVLGCRGNDSYLYRVAQCSPFRHPNHSTSQEPTLHTKMGMLIVSPSSDEIWFYVRAL